MHSLTAFGLAALATGLAKATGTNEAICAALQEQSDRTLPETCPADFQTWLIFELGKTPCASEDCEPADGCTFYDRDDNEVSEEQYSLIIQQMEEGIAKYGETLYTLKEQTGMPVEEMLFQPEPIEARAAWIPDVYPGPNCMGEPLAINVSKTNTCYRTKYGNSIFTREQLLSRCVLSVWSDSSDCKGEGRPVVAGNSPSGCFSMEEFGSVRLDCTQES